MDVDQGIMLKVLQNGIHRTMHILLAMVSADLANCNDPVHHAVASIVLQAFGFLYLG